MKKELFIKGLAFIVIILFIGANVILGVSGGSINNHLKHSSNSCSRSDQIIFLAVANSYSNNITIFHGDGLGGFSHYMDYPVDDEPWHVITDDFNFDGVPDLAVTIYDDDDVSVLLGDGFGGFLSRRDYFSGGSPVNIATGDFNNDGVLDLAVVYSAHGDVDVLLGDGFGGFSYHEELSTGRDPNGIATGDFNNDGNIDFAVTNDEMFGEPGNIDIFLGDGTGSFTFHREHMVYNVPCCMVSGDFNQDGNIDLVVTHLGGGYSLVLLGDGNGGFSSKHDFETGCYAYGIVSDDFNHDGILDLAITKGNERTVSAFLGDGNGMFINRIDYSVGTEPRGVDAGDFNRDGHPDLAVANRGNDDISVLFGDGTGRFGNRTDYPAGDGPDDVAIGVITVAEPGLEIGEISAGIASVKAEVKNTGVTDFTNVRWKISVIPKGLLGIFVDEIASSHGTISLLASDHTAKIYLYPVFGLAKVTIAVTASTFGGGTAKKTVEGVIIGPFIFLKKGEVLNIPGVYSGPYEDFVNLLEEHQETIWNNVQEVDDNHEGRYTEDDLVWFLQEVIPDSFFSQINLEDSQQSTYYQNTQSGQLIQQLVRPVNR